MKFSEPLQHLLGGLISLGLGVIFFSYLSKQKEEKYTDLLSQVHTFGLYLAACMFLIGGFFLICTGFKGVFL